MDGVGVRVAIALGANLGERAATFDAVLAALAPLLAPLRCSTYHDTAPVDVAGPQPRFLNAAAIGWSTQPARAVLDALLDIERRFGRERPHPGAARTLDLDLIFYGNTVLDEPGLTVPHPRFRGRLFVLEPLAELAADWIDPVSGLTVAELLDVVRPGR